MVSVQYIMWLSVILNIQGAINLNHVNVQFCRTFKFLFILIYSVDTQWTVSTKNPPPGHTTSMPIESSKFPLVANTFFFQEDHTVSRKKGPKTTTVEPNA